MASSVSDSLLVLKPGQQIKPQVDENDVRELVFKLYGLKVRSLVEFNAYDDKNFFVKVEDEFDNPHIEKTSSDGYVFKVVNSLDSRNLVLIDAQTKLMLFMQNQGFSVNSPVKNIKGEYKSLEKLAENLHIVKLLTFLPGSILCDVKCDNKLCFQTGKLAGKFDLAAMGFYDPAFETAESIWKLSKALEVRNFVKAVDDGERQQIVLKVLNEFENNVIANLEQLPRGVIHGDMNEQNLVVRRVRDDDDEDRFEVYGIIDFGDSQLNCIVFELALVATYCMLLASNIEDCLEFAGHSIAGYVSERKLSTLEWDVLKICIETRLCQSLVMGAYTNKEDPTNTYALTTAKNGWNVFGLLRNTSKESLSKKWETILDEYGL